MSLPKRKSRQASKRRSTSKGREKKKDQDIMAEIRAMRKYQGPVPARPMRAKPEYNMKRRKAITSPDTHVRIYNRKSDFDFVFERAKPDEIKTSMKIDWKLDKKKYTQGWARGLSKEVKLVKMSPDTYLEINPMPTRKDWPWKPSMRSIKKGLDAGATFETPFILIDHNNVVVGQEGRHRALALSRYGDEEMPVAIIFSPQSV